MSLRLLCVFIICVCLPFYISAQNRRDEKCGTQVSEKQYPWLAGIEFIFLNKHKILSTGALIDRRHVVATKLSLQVYGGPKSVQLGLYSAITGEVCSGENSAIKCTNDGGIRVLIEKIIEHPKDDANTNSAYDIALIELQEIVPFTDDVRPICLPIADFTRSAATNRDLYITGLSYNLPNQKLHIPTTYLEKSECEDLRALTTKNMICAKDAEESKLVLMPGATLMNKRGNRYELLGLLALSPSATTHMFNSIFVYLDWIRSKIPELSFDNRNTDNTGLGGCGRRKVEHIELIVNGEVTKAGDWPWHVAIYKLKRSSLKYICGGTLISKTMVLTAAHCATENGVPVIPDILSVILGKYNLIGGDIESQERQVHSVIPHENFTPKNHSDNDIALLKLRTEATNNDYVQPACIWSTEVYGRLSSNRIFGSVVGWGFDQSEDLSLQLKHARIPVVADLICIRKNPLFYTKVLSNDKKFCAGWANGTSSCNGDSGGGFLVFVPDSPTTDSSDAAGAWYIRGIVSLSASLRNYARCDPYQYVVFTDVDKYSGWIQKYLGS